MIGVLTYRNFEIRAEQLVRAPPHIQGLWVGWMREIPDGRWRELSLLDDTENEALDCARKCVDYDYRIKVWEFLNERKYSPTKDGLIEAFD